MICHNTTSINAAKPKKTNALEHTSLSVCLLEKFNPVKNKNKGAADELSILKKKQVSIPVTEK